MDYRIVCTRQEPAQNPPSHAHIVAVGVIPYSTGRASGYDDLLTVAQVAAAINQGHQFWTWSPSTGKPAQVSAILCRSCDLSITLRSAPDAVTDNNLDSLSKCV